MIRLAFITTGLGTGGAEMTLHRLLTRLDRERFRPAVFSLRGQGTFGECLRFEGIPVHAADLGAAGGGLLGPYRLRRALADFDPHLLQGWMYHGNLAALLAGLALPGRRPVLWGVRQSLYDLRHEKTATALVIRLSAICSPFACRIVYNSRTGAAHHEAFGFKAERGMIIPNGFDTELFAPSADARREVRCELGVPEDVLLIGLIARFHPIKDHAGFVKAAAQVAQACPEAKFLLVGTRIEESNPELAAMVDEAGLRTKTFLLGERSDIPRLTAALDIAVCASQAEGFSNVLGEAMSCGVPCAVTDVGDSASIVGETGAVASPGDAESLAAAILRLASLPGQERVRLASAARERIEKHFSIEAMVRHYENLYAEIAGNESSCAE